MAFCKGIAGSEQGPELRSVGRTGRRPLKDHNGASSGAVTAYEGYGAKEKALGSGGTSVRGQHSALYCYITRAGVW